MLKTMACIIVGLIAWFFIDRYGEYQYWKKEQNAGRQLVSTELQHVKQTSREELEKELNDFQAPFEKNGFDPSHENTEKLAKIFILTDTLTPQSQNYYDYAQRFVKVGSGLRPGCHYEFLVKLYQREVGLPESQSSNFCNGWSELDKDFTYESSPHARAELRY